MIILGIDPGSRKAGFAIIQVVGRKFNYLASTVIHYDDEIFLGRLGNIYNSCTKIIEDFNPEEVALESLIYVKSPTALIKLAQARGAMLAAINQTHQGKIYEYSPNLVKSAAAGHGHATKEGIQKSLSLIYGKKKFSTDDESDALAVATCHALHRNSRTIGVMR